MLTAFARTSIALPSRPSRGAVLENQAACAEAITQTKSFLGALVEKVQSGTDAAMRPRFGDWPVCQHVLPFDLSRAWDKLHGIEHPRVWTGDRDRELWQALRG